MNSGYKDIFLKVLDIIGYSDDKEKFTDQFISLCQQKATTDLIEFLPGDKQKLLGQQISQNTTSEQVQKILAQYFTGQQYTKALEKATAGNFKEYLEKITPTLSIDQQNSLHSFLSSL